MSTDPISHTAQTCHNCTHKSPTTGQETFLCKLHDEHYSINALDCEDWEAKELSEHSAYECD